MSEHFGDIQDLLKRYNKQKREGLMWLICFLYSLNSMQSEGTCTPSTHTLAISGTTLRSVPTIKRYIRTLIGLNLIKREFPDGRTHVLIATEYGQKLYESRKQDPLILKARRKIEPLNKTLTSLLRIKSNSNHLGSNAIRQNGGFVSNETRTKPKLNKFDTLVLRSMLKKCTDSFEKLKELEKEIKWSIEEGWLMCQRGTGTYHLTPDAIRIGVWLVKQGKWKTPNGFEEWIKTFDLGENYMQDFQKVIKKCEFCGKEDESVKHILTREKGPKYLCPTCYVKNLNLETVKNFDMLKNYMSSEFEQYSSDPFDYEKFNAFVNGKYKMGCSSQKTDEAEENIDNQAQDDKILINMQEMKAFIRLEAIPEQFFKFHRK